MVGAAVDGAAVDGATVAGAVAEVARLVPAARPELEHDAAVTPTERARPRRSSGRVARGVTAAILVGDRARVGARPNEALLLQRTTVSGPC